MELSTNDLDHSSVAETPNLLCSGPPSPPGGFGPLTGLEVEAPEEPEPPTTEGQNQVDNFAPIATRTRRRIATTKCAYWPDVLFDPGALAERTHLQEEHDDGHTVDCA